MTDLGLSDATAAFLKSQQAAIDAIMDFPKRKEEMFRLWENRAKTEEGQTAFEEIKAKLKEMAVGKKFCNYCEHNLILKSTLEHIRPKSAFPGYAFKWENLLYPCENCNMGYKKAMMYVFSPADSTNPVKTGQASPPSDDIAFIHPRVEDGMAFMDLSFIDFQFYCKPEYPIGSREFIKFEKTIEILHLDDEDLAHARETAFDDFKKCLAEYCAVLTAQSHLSLRKAVHGIPPINELEDLGPQKTKILESIRASFFKKTHLTVWREMQRRTSELSAELQSLFQQSGAATW